MGWKVDAVSQRAELVTHMRSGTASVTELCELYGVSRKTAYKWRKRYEAGGVEGLRDASRAPRRRPTKTSAHVEQALVAAREAHPLWGARKLAAWLARKRPELDVPAPSTCHDILERHGLVRRRRYRPPKPMRTELTDPTKPNSVWSVDFKGHFRLGNGRYCYPLTLQDAWSRALLRCDALPGLGHSDVRQRFERAFRRYGLPDVIRSDNGVPFAAMSGHLGWSRLSVWWAQLGIVHERIEPAKPQQNGRHERMHRTLKKHTTRPPRHTLGAQQRCFHTFRREYNDERPHEALDMQTPSSVYRVSSRRYPAQLPPLNYPGHFERRCVSAKGFFEWNSRRYFLSESLGRHCIGLEEVDDGLWRVYFGCRFIALLSDGQTPPSLVFPGSKALEELSPMSPDNL